jgi:hypothetical protein
MSIDGVNGEAVRPKVGRGRCPQKTTMPLRPHTSCEQAPSLGQDAEASSAGSPRPGQQQGPAPNYWLINRVRVGSR